MTLQEFEKIGSCESFPRQPDESETVRDPVISDEFATGASGVRMILNQLKNLYVPNEDGDPPPTQHALERAYEILEGTSYALQMQSGNHPEIARHCEMPPCFVSADEHGGIHLDWWHNRTHGVTLVVGPRPELRPYLFLKNGAGDAGRMVWRILPGVLAEHILQLNKLKSSQG